MSSEILDPNEELMLRSDIEYKLFEHANELAIIQDYNDLEVPVILVLGGNYLHPRSQRNSLVQVWVSNNTSERGKENVFIKLGNDDFELEPGIAINKNRGEAISPKEFRDLRHKLSETIWDGDYSAELAENGSDRLTD